MATSFRHGGTSFAATLRAFLWIVGILLIVPECLPAALDPTKPLHQFVLQNWQADQGLPQNSVFSIAQTRDGYLWLGTEEGLARYDGVRFVNFDSGNSALKDNVVRTLLVDRQNTLWIGTQYGGLFTYRDGKFSAVLIPRLRTVPSVNTLIQDRNGVVWVGTDNSGLIQLAGGKYQSITMADGLPDNGIVSLSESSDGTIWIVTHKGLSKLQHGQLSRLGKADGLTSDDVRTVQVDHEGSVWVGTANGLNRLTSGQFTNYTTRDGLSGNDITSLAEDSAHSLWIGTGHSGLNRFAKGKFNSLSTDASLSGTDISSLFEDRQGDLWIGTGGHGLVGLKEGAFTTLTMTDGLSSNSILPVFEDSQSNLWIGSEHGLTRRAHGKTKTFTSKDGLASDLIFSITQDASGAMWVGTRLGISRIIGDTVQTFRDRNGLPMEFALLFSDHTGNVWIGTRGGLSRFDGRALVTFTVKDGLPDGVIRCIQEDRTGTIWIGTSAGLTSLKNGKFRNYSTGDGSSNTILAIYCDPEDVLWLATSKGLSRYKEGHFTALTNANRSLEGLISAVLEDGAGFLWLSSNRGIIKLPKQELNRFADGISGQPVESTSFGTADGLRTRECNGGFQPAGWVAHDGKLYFPTAAGLAVTDPGRKREQAGSTTVIERMIINNKEYATTEAITSPVGTGKLEIQFTSPDLYFQNKMQFRYMLEGFDKDWVYADTRRTAYYTNISYGEYRFRAQSGVNGAWKANSLSPVLTLEPHFYETKAFLALVALCFLSLVIGSYRFRMNQIAGRERKLRALVAERTSALQESESQLRQSRDELELRVTDRTKELTHVNRSLEEEIQTRRQTEELLILAKEAAESANRAKSDFLTNMSHELRTPINGILGMTEITLSTELDPEQTEYLEIAKQSADSLLSIVNDILDFSKIEARKLSLNHIPFQLRKATEEVFRSLQVRAKEQGLQFELKIADDVPDSLVGDPLRIRQVLLNLLDNALKFTKQGRIELMVAQAGCANGFAEVHFAVKDTGIGIPANKKKTIFEAFSQADNSSTRRYGGTGLGLTISHNLAVMLGGDLWVDSEPGIGSTFHFTARLAIETQGGKHEVETEYMAPHTV